MRYLLRLLAGSMLCMNLQISYAQPAFLRFHEPDAFLVKEVPMMDSSVLKLPYEVPLYSLLLDDQYYVSSCSPPKYCEGKISFILGDSIQGTVTFDTLFRPGLKYNIRFVNTGQMPRRIENLVPLGDGADKVFITAEGTKDWPDYLCRTKLYRPGYGPVGVILPDNAWHLGFADWKISDSLSLVALARRTSRDKERTQPDRWAITLKSGGWVEYSLWFDIHRGEWQEGLRLMFQERWLYDLTSFDHTLFDRPDLAWMKHAYLMLLQFAWDQEYWDERKSDYTFYSNLFQYDSLTGGYDIFTLWPTWPRLGLDQRNQWDMYRDLPGGIPELRRQADFAHAHGKRYFISYNPWDESGRKEDHLQGMERLLRETDADGVVLDTRGASSFELQATADRVKPGIIMYSEGMAIAKDMPGIVSGRVHDALVLPPPVNLNKLIKPDFAIFRVLQLADDRLHRELACAFFNGYGVEINTARPGRPGWINEEYAYLGRTTKILRENTTVFHNYNLSFLLPSRVDSIYVNRWTDGTKILYTILSMNPEGCTGPLFEAPESPQGYHYVDIWNHQEIEPVSEDSKTFLPVKVDSFSREWIHTRREGNVGCIALLPLCLKVDLSTDYLSIHATAGDLIRVTGGDPGYRAKAFTFPASGGRLAYRDSLPRSTEKIVVQLFNNGQLLDEQVLFMHHNIPHLITTINKTTPSVEIPDGMVRIPPGMFRFYTKRDSAALEAFIPFPDYSDTIDLVMPGFYIDRFPVTNRQWKEFMDKTHYLPADTTNYLRHWKNHSIPPGSEDCPVVFVGPEDVSAYAAWQSKRLPTEQEWQYAAQGADMRKYPWGDAWDSTRCNYNLNVPTPVGTFSTGASPFGVEDMIGNVWQMTGDVYDNGCYYYRIIRGGSYYHPTSSIWYIAGGPLPAYHPEMLLLVGPGLNRNATVGFRLVKDTGR